VPPHAIVRSSLDTLRRGRAGARANYRLRRFFLGGSPTLASALGRFFWGGWRTLQRPIWRQRTINQLAPCGR
jgi:hypothetical protein